MVLVPETDFIYTLIVKEFFKDWFLVLATPKTERLVHEAIHQDPIF
jgi:predicted sugar kinase